MGVLSSPSFEAAGNFTSKENRNTENVMAKQPKILEPEEETSGGTFKVKKPKSDKSEKIERTSTSESQTQVTVAEARDVGGELPPVPEPAELKKKLVPGAVRDAPAGDPKEWVEFNCYERIDPSPTIGAFSFSRDLSITMLEAKKIYTIPRFVAEVLEDKKKGTIMPG